MNEDNKITRRDALKRMGAAVISGAVASSGLLSLASCEGKKNKRIILYFTGTGNCLYIARQLAGENAELLSIPQLVKQERYELEADEIGLVYPVYGHRPPAMVQQYLKKAILNAPYRFAVLTYGARKCNSVELLDAILQKTGKPFDYIATIMMVDNWLPNFDMNEQIKMDKKVPENLARITNEINERKHWHEPVTEEERQIHRDFMGGRPEPEEPFMMRSEQAFVISDKCIDCGICTYVCPRGNYDLTNKGVKTSGDCDFCFACIQNCPQKAIGFARMREVNPNARYRNEHISLMDLKLANNQKL